MTNELLRASAWRLTTCETTRLGSCLEQYRRLHNSTAEQIAEHLKIDPERLTKLALCLVPREEFFMEDVRFLAVNVGASPTVLAGMIRQVETHHEWMHSPPTEIGWTLAAHQAKQPPPGNYDEPPGDRPTR